MNPNLSPQERALSAAGAAGPLGDPDVLAQEPQSPVFVEAAGVAFDKQQMDAITRRFLTWKLPPTFSPDAGISFTPSNGMSREDAYAKGRWPVGTNLLTFDEAQTMLEHVLNVTFTPLQSADTERLCWAIRKYVKMIPAGEECRVQLTVGVQSFLIGTEPMQDAEAALVAGWFVFALAGMVQQIAAGNLPSEDSEVVVHSTSAPAEAVLGERYRHIGYARYLPLKDGGTLLMACGPDDADGFRIFREPRPSEDSAPVAGGDAKDAARLDWLLADVHPARPDRPARIARQIERFPGRMLLEFRVWGTRAEAVAAIDAAMASEDSPPLSGGQQ